jgi:beta-glucosidase
VVLNTGAPVAMPWFERAGAVVQAWLPGQEFGNALGDVLTGRVNPSGRLPCTVPRRLEDTPAFTSYPGEAGHVLYGERMFVGYRWYDSRAIEPLLPFGHGLSYTRFDYRELAVRTVTGGVEVAAVVDNVGERDGQEVVQLYVAPEDSRVQRPAQELRAFLKVEIPAGASASVRFLLTPRDFAIWDVAAGSWCAPAGDYELRLGTSSRDVRLRGRWSLTEDAQISA